MKKCMTLFKLIPVFCWVMAASLSSQAQDAGNVATVLEGDALVRRNGVYFNNRPLYAGQNNPEQRYYWVFAGDQPLMRFGGGANIDGCFLPGYRRADGTAKWLQDFKSRESRYHPGWMEWVASDPAFPGVTVTLQAVPLGTGFGLAVQAQVSGAAGGDQLVCLLGAAHSRWVSSLDALAPNSLGIPQAVRADGFPPAKARGNGVDIAGGVIRLDQGGGFKGRHTVAACSAAWELCVADAEQWQSLPAMLAAARGGTTAPQCPVAVGLIPIKDTQPITMIAHVWLQSHPDAMDVAAEYRAARARVEGICNRVISHTPDARFDFMVRAASSPAEALFRKEAFGHGCLSDFVDPLLGWRSTLAGVAYAWHDRVIKAGQTFLASQVKTEDYRGEPALAKIVDNEELVRFKGTWCHPGSDPRFFSRGRLIPNQNSTLYDMQSQFVDALVEDWRFTADPEMEKLLRPALELHLDYLDRVFDPDGDGTYESFCNTFLTDTVWYNGGGTPDETAFAWRGHLAARDMARRADDEAGVRKHQARLDLIRKGFFTKLWADKAGHPGAYREQGGHQRLHDEAWLPGLYLPLDCPGLMNDEQMASTLHFVEYALEHEPRPTGGVRVWPSNWVPSVWSNRTKAPGDEYHMALGYCQAGMPEPAMEIIRGNISEGSFESGVPGNLGFPGGSCGTDFGDCVAPFTRVVVSGVFGYRPDRPNGVVAIAPQFPADWDAASFVHPEFKLDYKRAESSERLSVELERESALEIEIPFRNAEVKSVKLNGRRVKSDIRPGFGRSICVVRTPVLKKAEVVVEVAKPLPVAVAQSREVEVGTPVELAVEGGKIIELCDAQGVLKSVRVAKGKADAVITDNVGYHRVLARVEMGKVPQWRIFDFKVRDPKAEQYVVEKNLSRAPDGVTWTGIDLDAVLNGRITDIFRQEYLSPRPDTMSLRLAKDGYEVWNGVYAGKVAPAIDLSNTRPRRMAPVYDADLSALKSDGELTIEVWAQADLCEPWSSVQIFQMGDVAMELMAHGGRLLRIFAPESIFLNSSLFGGDRSAHLVLVLRKGHGGEIYFDGKKNLVGTAAVNPATLALGPRLRLGANLQGGNRLLGRIDRIAIATRAATADELKARTLDSAPLPGTVADWRIPEGDAAQVASAVAGGPVLVRQEIASPPPKALGAPLKVAEGMLEVPQGAKFMWAPGPVKKDIAFTSLWDNWPRKVTVPVNKKGHSVWLLVAGSSNPMQVRIANAVLRFEYDDGVKEELELVNPMNFWSLCAFHGVADYDYRTDAFALPKTPPPQVQLGSNCRAMVYGWKLRPGVELKQVTLESLSEEVIIGLMGLSICGP